MNYHNITTDDMLNGDGLRTVLWVSGCTFNCPNCQNPQTHSFDSGRPFTDDTMEELIEDLDKPYISGLTLSGGHPLEPQNIPVVYNIVKTVKEKFPDKTIWIYTGYTYEDIYREYQRWESLECNSICAFDVIKLCNVLVDGRYIDELRDISLPWRGSSNQRVIDVKATLASDTPEIPILYCN